MKFSPETLDFLIENRLHNSKEWYHDHLDTYKKYVASPIEELAAAVAPRMMEVDDRIVCNPRIGRSISRIYRDTRFTKDKSLFRDNLWINFMRDKHEHYDQPGFFFDISPDGFTFGCGYYWMERGTLDAMRSMILRGDPVFEDARNAYETQSLYSIEGTMYKRSKYPTQPENLRLWLDRKDLSFIARSDDYDLLFSDKLADYLIENLPKLAPEYEFMLKCETEQGL